MVSRFPVPFAFALLQALLAGVPVAAQETVSQPVVQALPAPEVQRLNRALVALAKAPRDRDTLIEAGQASLGVDDLEAAIGFFGRAAGADAGQVDADGLAQREFAGELSLGGELRPVRGAPCLRSRWRRLAKSTRSSSWSWLKQENTTVSLPVTGSLWSCRHWAQISFIMHCMGELIDPSARWPGLR